MPGFPSMPGMSIEDISSMDMPGMEGKLGISMPPKSEDIMLVLELELDEEEKEEVCIEEEPMFIPPMFMLPIILLIMSSMPRLGICMPPPSMLPIGGIPPIMDGMPPIMGMLPPDIMVEEDEDELLDLKLEMVDPSGDCVVAAMLWLLAFSFFFTAVPSSVTKACDWAFMASLT